MQRNKKIHRGKCKGTKTYTEENILEQKSHTEENVKEQKHTQRKM